MPTQVLTEVGEAPVEERVGAAPKEQEVPVVPPSADAGEPAGIDATDADGRRLGRVALVGPLVVLAGGTLVWLAVARIRARRRSTLLRRFSAVSPPAFRRARPGRFAFVTGRRPLERIAVDGHAPFVHVGR